MFGSNALKSAGQPSWHRSTNTGYDTGLPVNASSISAPRGYLSDLSNIPPYDGTPARAPTNSYEPVSHYEDTSLHNDDRPVFVDSSFFVPGQHPSLKEQVTMAKQISASLSDARNRNSKGQSMYEKRKKRSPKWIHQGDAPLTAEDLQPAKVSPKSKPLLKLILNPQGGVVDLQALRAQGIVIGGETGLSPEICSELVKDLHSANGIGGQIFAKRKKRSEKWVVDEFHPEQSRPGERPTTVLNKPRPKPPSPQMPVAPPPPQKLAVPPSPPPVAPAVNLADLCPSPRTPLFPKDGVYSPRLAQGWGATQTPSSYGTAPVFPVLVEREPLEPEPEPEPVMEPPPLPEVEPDPAMYMDYIEPPPTCTKVDTIEESLRLLEEKRKQRHAANYNTAPRGWGSHGIYYQPVTFADTEATHESTTGM